MAKIGKESDPITVEPGEPAQAPSEPVPAPEQEPVPEPAPTR